MKISIVIPSYNQAQFIGRTLESILTQEGNFEVECLVFDGGSTDNTVQILKETEKRIADGNYKKFNKNTTFFWTSKKDKGQSDAINQGMKMATGDIVAWLNSDDSYQENAFATVQQTFSQNKENGWLTGYCQIIDQNDNPLRGLIAKYKNFWLRHYSYNKLLILNFISQPATFWKVELVKKCGYLDEKLHYTMDYDYWLRFGKVSAPIVIKLKLANFRIHGQSKGETAFVDQFNQDLMCAQRYTKKKLILMTHGIHNFFIKLCYKVIK